MRVAHLPHGLPPAHPAAWLATWFFSGLLPGAPGTWGSLAALPFAWAIATFIHPLALLPAAAVAVGLGIWASDVYMRHDKSHDPGAVVIDEVAGLWLTLAVAPVDIVAYGLGFAFFRLADIVKPWPVGWLDKNIGGGLGVMLDDVGAAIYAGTALWLVLTYAGPFLAI